MICIFPTLVRQIKDTSVLERVKPSERASFLDSVCVGDDSLRREIESLIQAYEQTGKLIDAPAYEALAELTAEG